MKHYEKPLAKAMVISESKTVRTDLSYHCSYSQ